MVNGDEKGRGGGFPGWQCGDLMLGTQTEEQVSLLLQEGEGRQ